MEKGGKPSVDTKWWRHLWARASVFMFNHSLVIIMGVQDSLGLIQRNSLFEIAPPFNFTKFQKKTQSENLFIRLELLLITGIILQLLFDFIFPLAIKMNTDHSRIRISGCNIYMIINRLFALGCWFIRLGCTKIKLFVNKILLKVIPYCTNWLDIGDK